MPEFTPEQIDARIMADPGMKQLANEDPTEFLSQHERIYHTFGYRPDGTALSTAQKGFGSISRATGIPEGIVQGVAATPLPTLGAIGGAMAGATGGLVGTAIGAAGGSVLGEAANSLLGITDPMDAMDMGIAAGAPLAGTALARTGPAMIKLGKRLIPGAGAGLNELAGERLATKLNSMRVTKTDVEAMRGTIQLAPDFKVDIPLTRDLFKTESGDIGRQAAAAIPGSDKYLKELNTQITNIGQSGTVSFKDLMTLEQGFNRIKGERPDELWGKASGLIIDDMDNALKNPKLSAATKDKISTGLTAFKSFIATNRKYHADETLVDLFKVDGKVVKSVSGDPNLVLFDQKAFKSQLNNNKILNKAFSPAEIESVRESVSGLGYISKPPSGNGDAINLARRYGAGGMIGWVAGGPMGAVAGAGVEELLRRAVTSEPGRRIVKYLAKEGRGKIDSVELNTMLGKAMAGAMAGVAGINQPAGLPTNQE